MLELNGMHWSYKNSFHLSYSLPQSPSSITKCTIKEKSTDISIILRSFNYRALMCTGKVELPESLKCKAGGKVTATEQQEERSRRCSMGNIAKHLPRL